MQLQRILVGVDFSPESEVAVDHAVRLARAKDARIILAHVLSLPADLVEDSPYDPIFRAQGADQVGAMHRDQATGMLEDAVARCRELGVEAEALLVDDNPSDGLARAASDVAADLMAVGTHGRTGLKRFLLGSVAERAVRLASVDSLVARGPIDEAGYRFVVVATDFSPAAGAALAAALEVASPKATILVVHSWQTPTLPNGTPLPSARGELERIVVERGERLVAGLEDSRVSFAAVERPAAEGICGRAEEEGCDLIVTGSHGRRGVRRWLLGSVTESVVRHAPCSVLVVRPPDPDGATSPARAR